MVYSHNGKYTKRKMSEKQLLQSHVRKFRPCKMRERRIEKNAWQDILPMEGRDI